jgi:hypothetical protein
MTQHNSMGVPIDLALVEQETKRHVRCPEGVFDPVTHECSMCGTFDPDWRYQAQVVDANWACAVVERRFEDWYPAEVWVEAEARRLREERKAGGWAPGVLVPVVWDLETGCDVLGRHDDNEEEG